MCLKIHAILKMGSLGLNKDKPGSELMDFEVVF